MSSAIVAPDARVTSSMIEVALTPPAARRFLLILLIEPVVTVRSGFRRDLKRVVFAMSFLWVFLHCPKAVSGVPDGDGAKRSALTQQRSGRFECPVHFCVNVGQVQLNRRGVGVGN